MAELLKPDICVIGGGSGGLTVAAAAAAFGVPVVLIESGKMGGDCLNYGCVPSKGNDRRRQDRRNHAPGREVRRRARSSRLSTFPASTSMSIPSLPASRPTIPSSGFTAARRQGDRGAWQPFTGPDTVVAGDYEIKARRFVVATGSSAMVPPIPGFDDGSLTSPMRRCSTGHERPDHLIIIGGGPIGMEMAQAHRRLGSEVTVLEAFKALGKDDPELAAIVLEKIRGEGVSDP